MSLCVSAWSAIKLNNYPDFACNSVTCVWSVYVRVAVHDVARQTVARVCIDFVDRWCCIACVATMRCALPFIRQTHYMNITMQYAPHTHIVCVVQLLCTWHHTSTSIIIIIISATPDGHNLLRIWRNVSGDWVASKWSVISVCVVGEHVIDFNISSFFTLIILRELQRN